MSGGKKLPAPVFFRDDGYRGMGLSKGLARGVQVMVDGVDLTQEGMGLGTIAIRSRGYTYFSQQGQATWIDAQHLLLDYLIDTVHVSRRKGKNVANPLLTRMRELGVVLYRRLPAFQHAMLRTGIKVRRSLGIQSAFVPVPPLARAQFQFKFEPHRVEVRVHFDALAGDIDEIFIMNELGADFFDLGWQAGCLMKPPSGWEVLEGTGPLPFLYSSKKQIRYSLAEITLNQALPLKVCWGREHIEDLCWAGFTIQINPVVSSISGLICRYTVVFQEDDHEGGAHGA